MFTELKKRFYRWLSNYTDKPIFIGTGITTTDTYSPVDEIVSNTPPIKSYEVRFRLHGTNEVFRFVSVRPGRQTGTIYIVLNHVISHEEMIVSDRLFNKIFIRLNKGTSNVESISSR